MLEIFQKLLPIFIPYVMGVSLRHLEWVNDSDGKRILNMVFYVCIPFLLLAVVPELTLTIALLRLPLIAVITVTVTFCIVHFTMPRVVPNVKLQGVVITACMLMNTGFMLPFMHAFFGSTGIVYTMVFDLGNATLAYSLVYMNAFRYGDALSTAYRGIRKLVGNPSLWAMIFGLIMNGFSVQVPHVLREVMGMIGELSFPLILFALGLFFRPTFEYKKVLVYACIMRTGLGLCLGVVLAWIFDLQGPLRAVAICCTAAPVGYNTLIFSSLADLDVGFAASLVSTSILLGMLYVPIVIGFMI